VNTKEDNKDVQLLKYKLWQQRMIAENHDLADVGHPGQHRMLELIKRTYWWPDLKKDIKKYVQGYFKC